MVGLDNDGILPQTALTLLREKRKTEEASTNFTSWNSTQASNFQSQPSGKAIELLGSQDRILEMKITFCAFELYNEKAYDLLQSREHIPIKKFGNEVCLNNLVSEEIKDERSFEIMLNEVLRNRSMGETFYNPNSSRSHTFYQFHVKVKCMKQNKQCSLSLRRFQRWMPLFC